MNRMKPYSRLTEFDVSLYKSGHHYRIYEKLGAHPTELDGEMGCYFAVWAPSAHKVEVVGDWNYWDGAADVLAVRWDSSGIWEGWLPHARPGHRYKFRIYSTIDEQVVEKIDPYARRSEVRPQTASIIADINYEWRDSEWMANRGSKQSLDQPMSVYEVHMGSWRYDTDRGEPLTYTQAANDLVHYVQDMGFTHVELLPITTYPLDESWGYQATGYYSPTERYGKPEELMHLIDYCHEAGIGVLLDWVPAHFPSDEWGLAQFDGSHLYEHPDPRKGYHPDWKSLIFNYERPEVSAFLISSALYWLEHYHIDGLRVDTVASMLYLDYSRDDGEWEPNIHGDNHNLAAIDFIKALNKAVYQYYPSAIMIAEESTSYTGVTTPVHLGGLGFGVKWMMGWMNDTLQYFAREPIHRKYHHNEISFSGTYAFTENFMLPLSHDEVVHGKGPLIYKMPGDDWQRFANLRTLYTYMWTHAGSKLLFMGNEFAQTDEWQHNQSLDWHLLDYAPHQGMQALVKDLNTLYRSETALHNLQYEVDGWQWISYDDHENSVLAYARLDHDGNKVITVLNLTPQPLHDYRIGVAASGTYDLVINSDASQYGGSGHLAWDTVASQQVSMHGREQSIELILPPLSGIVYKKKLT